MADKKFLIISPVWNHKQHWQENLIQCFLDQSHPHKTMVLIDDRPVRLDQGNPFPGVHIVESFARFPSLMAKYQFGVEWAIDAGIRFDAISAMEDDDLYLADFLAVHNRELQNKEWSYNSHIYSTVGDIVRTEPCYLGMTWTTGTCRRELFDKAGGFGTTGIMGFDQEYCKRLLAHGGEPSRPSEIEYLYTWECSQDSHTSGLSTGYDDTTWYQRTPYSRVTGPLEPKYNDIALGLMAQIKALES